MLINEFAGSGGDAMPWYFRRAGVGKLIGKRTWGGLVGRAGSPPLMDGGIVTAPSSGVWDPEESDVIDLWSECLGQVGQNARARLNRPGVPFEQVFDDRHEVIEVPFGTARRQPD